MCFFCIAQCCVNRFAAVIGCRPVQLRPEAFWSAPVGDGNQKRLERSPTNCSLQFVWDLSVYLTCIYVVSWHCQTTPAYYNADVLLKNIVFNAHREVIKRDWDSPNSLTRDQKAKQEMCRIFVLHPILKHTAIDVEEVVMSER